LEDLALLRQGFGGSLGIQSVGGRDAGRSFHCCSPLPSPITSTQAMVCSGSLPSASESPWVPALTKSVRPTVLLNGAGCRQLLLLPSAKATRRW